MFGSQLQLPEEFEASDSTSAVHFTTKESPCPVSYESVRSHNVGSSDYSTHSIQPWDIWIEYKLNPFDADIVKRVLRQKNQPGKSPTQSRIEDYEKIIHICQERLRQLYTDSDPWACCPHHVTNRELSDWITQGKGEFVFTDAMKGCDGFVTVHSYEYDLVEADNPVPAHILVRTKGSHDWVSPTRSYLGLK